MDKLDGENSDLDMEHEIQNFQFVLTRKEYFRLERLILLSRAATDYFWLLNLNNYFDRHVCPSVRACVCHKIFFLLKSPWNHPLTSGVDPRG